VPPGEKYDHDNLRYLHAELSAGASTALVDACPDGITMTLAPGFQLAGVATMPATDVCKSINRRGGASIGRPMVTGQYSVARRTHARRTGLPDRLRLD
jgi:hypothetical protein